MQFLISYNGYIGAQNPNTIIEMMNSSEYSVMKNAVVKNQISNAKLPFSEADLAKYKKAVENANDSDFNKYSNSNAVDFVSVIFGLFITIKTFGLN